MDKAMHSEFEEAVRMANKALDVPNADPDDDLRTVSRQFLRSTEQNQSLRSELQSIKAYHEERLEAWHLELQKQKELVETLKKAMRQGNEMYANLKFDDEPFTPYQLALQEVEKLKELNAELVKKLENL